MIKKLSLLLFLSLTLSIAISSCSNEKRTLYIYNWSDYMSSDIMAKFEKEYNCNIITDYFDSNESMYAKLRVSGGSYDIIVPSSYMAAVMKEEKMLTKLDKSKIPNTKDMDMKYSAKTEDPNMEYSIPYAISFTGLGYNKKKLGKLIENSWSAFGNPEYKHKITMLNDMREALGASLKYLSYSLNTVDDNQLHQAKEQMLKWKKNIAAYQSDEAKSSLAYNILNAIQCYNGDIISMQEDNPDLAFALPKEGTSIGVDTIVIPLNAQNPELAYEFINFMYEPRNCADNMDYIGYLCPNKPAMTLLDKEFVPTITINEELFNKSEVIKDLGADNTKYVEIWEEILASDE